MMPQLQPDHYFKLLTGVVILLSFQIGIVQAQQDVRSSGNSNTTLGSLSWSSRNLSLDLMGPQELGNVRDDVGHLLKESDEKVDALFPYGPLAPLHKLWDQGKAHLNRSLELDLGLNYTVVYQWADTTVRGPTNAGDGDLDFFWSLESAER